MPQPFHVREQISATRLTDHLAEYVSKQADIAPHQVGKLGRVALSESSHESEPNHQGVTAIITGVNLSPMTAEHSIPGELPDPHTTAGKIADLERRRYEAVHAGSEQAVAKQHDRGKLTARERIHQIGR